MKLIILGSGTSSPHASRASAAHWLETDAGTLLLDISADAGHRMAQEQLDWPNLDAIWISHFHLDHCGGLAPFLFATRHSLETQQRKKPLTIYGPTGIRRILETFDRANNYRLFEQPFPVKLVEAEPESEFEILPEVVARTFSTPHTTESLAVRMTDKTGSVFVYTSDTGFCEDLAAFAQGASLLLVECSFYKNKPVQIHLELAEAMRLAKAAAPERVVLSHLYSEWDGVDLVGEAKKLWPGETVEAVDGLRIEF